MQITIDNININYDFFKNENSDVLAVLLHGWGSNYKLFQGVMATMAEKFSVAALDMPGFGESQEPPEAWDVGRYTDFVIKFIESFGYKKVILLGHSFGGRVIIKMLAERTFDFSVEKVILVDSAGIKPKKTFRQKARQRVFKMGKGFLNFPPVKKLFPDALGNWRKKFGSADYNSASEVMKLSLIKTVNEDLTQSLPLIKTETLLVWGDKDDATPLSDGQTMEKLIPGSGLAVIKNAGHYSFLEQRYVFDKIIRSFLNING